MGSIFCTRRAEPVLILSTVVCTVAVCAFFKMRYVQAFLINSQILTIAVRIFINEQGTVPKDSNNFTEWWVRTGRSAGNPISRATTGLGPIFSLGCCPHLSLPRRRVPFPVGTNKGVEEKCCCQRLYYKMPILQGPVKQGILNPKECWRHLSDEYDPKHYVQRYVRGPKASPHSIRNLVISKEQCIAVCALHLNAV